MIMVSACLLGRNCKYSGGNNYRSELDCDDEFLEFCPECAGGLEIPRAPAEIEPGFCGDDVISGRACVKDKEGKNVTEQFIKGAQAALEIAVSHNIKKAMLKQSSPSCGCGLIYDGTFSGTKKKGDGVTAALLKKNGIEVIGIE